jgi:hypothetical protein
MHLTKTLLEHGRQMAASCTSLHTLMVITMAELTLALVVPLKTNLLTSVLMTSTSESNNVVKLPLKSHVPLETAKVSVWSGKE